MTTDRFMELALGQAGTLVLALAVIWGFVTERIVAGKAYKREVSRADRLEGLALKSTTVAERVVSVAERGEP